jgi:hypothetical protein
VSAVLTQIRWVNERYLFLDFEPEEASTGKKNQPPEGLALDSVQKA